MKKLFTIIVFLFVSALAFTQSVNKAIPARPSPPQLVNDFTKTLTNDQQKTLEEKLVAFDKESSTQIAVVLVNDLQGYEISEYALAILRNWGVGQKDKNNGVVLLIAIEERMVRIETGYGAEGALPDATCKHIIDEEIVPGFKGKDYFGGINRGTDAIIRALKGEYSAPKGYGKKDISKGQIVLLILVIILFSFLSSRGGGGGSSSRT